MTHCPDAATEADRSNTVREKKAEIGKESVADVK